MMVGSGYSIREYCDGQTVASPGRWPVKFRKYPEVMGWKRVGTMELLMNFAMGRVTESPFLREAVDSLRNRIMCHRLRGVLIEEWGILHSVSGSALVQKHGGGDHTDSGRHDGRHHRRPCEAHSTRCGVGRYRAADCGLSSATNHGKIKVKTQATLHELILRSFGSASRKGLWTSQLSQIMEKNRGGGAIGASAASSGAHHGRHHRRLGATSSGGTPCSRSPFHRRVGTKSLWSTPWHSWSRQNSRWPPPRLCLSYSWSSTTRKETAS